MQRCIGSRKLCNLQLQRVNLRLCLIRRRLCHCDGLSHSSSNTLLQCVTLCTRRHQLCQRILQLTAQVICHVHHTRLFVCRLGQSRREAGVQRLQLLLVRRSCSCRCRRSPVALLLQSALQSLCLTAQLSNAQLCIAGHSQQLCLQLL